MIAHSADKSYCCLFVVINSSFSKALALNSSKKVSIDNFLFSKPFCENHSYYVQSISFTTFWRRTSQCDLLKFVFTPNFLQVLFCLQFCFALFVVYAEGGKFLVQWEKVKSIPYKMVVIDSGFEIFLLSKQA